MRAGEPNWLEVTEKSVSINRFDAPLRVLHLSDFHASESVSLQSIEHAIDIALTGCESTELKDGAIFTSA
ncbi:MAG: putative MPP superfamily phosphohydrolase [Lentimonas sp.]|jgi:hypothetical protein